MTTGRNLWAILRLTEFLRTTDAHGVATPANRQSGDKVIMPSLRTREALEELLKAGCERTDGYFCKKNLWGEGVMPCINTDGATEKGIQVLEESTEV